jgi:hypothetical protein
MEIAGIMLVFLAGLGLGIIGTRHMQSMQKLADRLADPTPTMGELLYAPMVEVEISHPFRSEPQLDTFGNMTAACAFLADRFAMGGFSQIVLTAIDDDETPADAPDWWEAEKNAAEKAIEQENEYATKAHAYSPGYSGMVCDATVERDGFGDSCGLPADHPVHADFTERGI